MFGEPEKSSGDLVRFLLGERLLREPASGSSTKCDEAMFGVQKASLYLLWEYSPISANIASDWLRANESSPVDEEKIKIDDGVDSSLVSERIDLFVDLWEAQSCLWDSRMI